MNPTSVPGWREIPLPAGTSLDDLNRTILSCARLVPLRLAPSAAQEGGRLEALVSDAAQHALAEAYVQQFLADQALRRAIREQSSDRIEALADRILTRAGGS